MKVSSSPKIDYFDQRSGYWTKVEFEDGRLIVRRCHKMHWLAATLSVLIFVLLVAPLVLTPVGIVFLLLIAWFIFSTWNGQRIADQNRFPIVVSDSISQAKSEFDHGQFFDRKKIRKISVRENKHRESDDVHLVQIYMQVKGLDKLVLLYQQSWSDESKEKAEKLAEKIRVWLKSFDSGSTDLLDH